MDHLKTSRQTADIVALVEDASINSTVRMTGVSKPTILKLIRDLGAACEVYHDEHVRGLKPEHVQTDEVWSFNCCKAKNVPAAKNAPQDAVDCWLWTALDSNSKLMIGYRVGLRTKEDANEFMLDLAGRIVSRTQLTSAGYRVCLDAADNAFGFDVDFAQLQKVYGADPATKGPERKYSPGKVNGTKKIKQIGLVSCLGNSLTIGRMMVYWLSLCGKQLSHWRSQSKSVALCRNWRTDAILPRRWSCAPELSWGRRTEQQTTRWPRNSGRHVPQCCCGENASSRAASMLCCAMLHDQAGRRESLTGKWKP